MVETVAPGFVTPQRGVQIPPVVSIVGTGKPLREGIRLIHNTDRYGFILGKEIEGFGLAPFENTTQPRASGGAVLRHRRTAEGSMFLPLTLVSPNPASMYDMMAWLVDTVTGQDEFFDVVYFDPYSQEARRRTVLYDSGLETVNEVIPDFKHVVGVTGSFLSPFWRGPERVVTERIAPPVKPLITADPGSPVNRWDDPEFADTTAYEPWFVVDAGLEKQGTGSEHGVFVSGHRVSVNPGETVSVSAGVSFVDGPQVGDIQVKVRAYDDTATLVSGSASTVMSESYAGTYTGTYVVPATGVDIELGFYTASDVHANTRVRIEDLDVKREVQYLAKYEWEGEPHASPSIKRDPTGQIVARNLMPNPSFENGVDGWRVTSSLDGEITSASWPMMAGIVGDRMLHATAAGGREWLQVRNTPSGKAQIPEGYQWAAGRFFVANGTSGNLGIRSQIVFQDSSGSTVHNNIGPFIQYPWYEGGWYEWAYPVPAGSTQIDIINQMWAGNDATIPAEQRFWLDGFHVDFADTEQEARDRVATYFDGDTPDVVDEGSREGSYSYPFFPVFLADSTVQGEHELRVDGDAPVWPVWEITGPGRDVEIIGPDGSRLYVSGEVVSPITIVTEPGKRSIRDASGLIWERMKPGDDQFFALQPGEQTVKMTMVGGNPESTIRAVYSENWKTPRGTAQGMIRGGVV